MTLSVTDFGSFHAAVHGGRAPFAWQQRLLEQIVADRAWPRVLDLPTGTGKTTCIDVALFALALDAERGEAERWCPRRIAMVVDRRIVVDQVAERGRKLLDALLTSKEPVVLKVADRLSALTGGREEPLGVYTLRGGMPKDDGWARSPDQPLVIASTVDQVGSRLLMQGYGVSAGMAPVHAGLLANDTLLLLDEVHLSEPFRQTLDQLASLRTRFRSGEIRTRFVHAFLSATPGASDASPFSLLEEEMRPDSPLGPRLHAPKPVRLVEVTDREALELACVEQALDLLARHRTIAVVVNRVASASAVAARLDAAVADDANVTLLTGRMRPLDRDDVLRSIRAAVQTGRSRSDENPKWIVVGTQSIEAGADFDFDAIVSEASSLDSLRQRFGRVDRLGAYGNAEGVIVFDKSSKGDPVYGNAIVETVKWFKGREKERQTELRAELRELKAEARKLRGAPRALAETHLARRAEVDFGVSALKVPTGEDLIALLAPKPDAPTLLPAYLDLWMQTSPPPSQRPDVSLWLHGPQAGPADVKVVWRADLSEDVLRLGDVDTAIAIVSAVRPSSLEAMALPFATARSWLAGEPVDDLGDTEGASVGGDAEPVSPERRVLRWRGDESAILDAATLKPGDTIVVPATYGGVSRCCFDATARAPVTDLAERAALLAHARPVLRLHHAVLDGLGLSLPDDDPDGARVGLRDVGAREDWPAWKRLWATRLAVGRGSFVVPGDTPWLVLRASRVRIAELRRVLQPAETLEVGVEMTTDGEDSFCAGVTVPLAAHCADVEELARQFAMRAGLDPWLVEHIALAGWLHDIGKADRRFQLMLRGGSEIDYYKDETPLAKSAIAPGAREARRRAQERSDYPRGARHEVQSLAMLHGQPAVVNESLQRAGISREPDVDLVLHLVASHHGHCRPFAPVASDANPVDVSLRGHESRAFGGIDLPATNSDHRLYRLDSPLADRFWGLVARYGWQELCWLETILRLADHRVSEREEETRA